MAEECCVDIGMPLVPQLQAAETSSKDTKTTMAEVFRVDIEIPHVPQLAAETSKDTKKKMAKEDGRDFDQDDVVAESPTTETTPESPLTLMVENLHVLQQAAETIPESTRSSASQVDQSGGVPTNENHGLNDKDMELLATLKTQSERDIKDVQNKILYTKIQRIPQILRQEKFNNYFKPRAIGIGLLHSRTKTSITGEVKHKLAAKFIELSGRTGECLLGVIKENIGDLKERYSEEVLTFMSKRTLEDDDLARFLFLDGCSLLQLIYSFHHEELNEFNINNGQAALVQQDLFLLENQIPFRVLRLLIDLSDNKDELIKSIKEFILMTIRATFHEFYSVRFHKLTSFYCCFGFRIGKSHLYHKRIRDLAFRIRFGAKGTHQLLLDKDPIHLLDLMRSVLLYAVLGGDINDSKELKNKSSPEPYDRFRRSFRNVHDLKTAGIKLKPNDMFSLRDISFTTRCFFAGELKLPPMIVDDSTTRKLWNLAAYEMCPDFHESDFGVVSYITFLDSLIDNEQDVKDLRSAHILRNHLSTDAEVARLFNTIGSCLVNTGDSFYLNVKKKIQKHYERRSATWIAQAYYDHFRSPWTMLALFAAATALLLTTIQTWYAVHPKN